MHALHPRAFTASVVWTLALLYLGSVVHATESSLACPDWPTCFGTLVPDMTGGVFWEHLHRLVAGGLLLLWGLATWLARKETGEGERWIYHLSLAGLGLLVVQSVFGGLTVLFRLPDLVSTTHLALALSFLALATVLASATSRPRSVHGDRDVGRVTAAWAGAAALLVLAQSVLGGLVRHTDAGMACPDAPLCLGRVVPPLDGGLVALHFSHRVLGLLTLAVVAGAAARLIRAQVPREERAWALWTAALTATQVGLGFLSVTSGLAVVPVSLHTLVAATILVALTRIATLGWTAARGEPAAARVAGGVG